MVLRTKAIRDLCQLPESDFLSEIALGLPTILNNSERYYASALATDATDSVAARALASLAGEEAAKTLILIDAVRCPRSPTKRLSDQLGRYNLHLAKGLYEEAYAIVPADFAELRSYVDSQRVSHYLDGPNDVDWVFENEVLHSRESRLYVDYVADDDGHHVWLDPRRHEDWMDLGVSEPQALRVAKAMHDFGMFTNDGVKIIAQIWRTTPFHDSTKWGANEVLVSRTLEQLRQQGLATQRFPSSASVLHEYWQFPMYDLDMSKEPVRLEDLHQVRRMHIARLSGLEPDA